MKPQCGSFFRMRTLPILLCSSMVLLSSFVQAGDAIDKSGPTPTPPISDSNAFSRADCEKEKAILQGEFKLKNQQLLDVKLLLQESENLNAELQDQLLKLKKNHADQLSTPAAVVEAESTAMVWLPWILALILAVVGFLIGRSSPGGSGNHS